MVMVSEGLLIMAIVLIVLGVFLMAYAGLPYPTALIGSVLVVIGVIIFAYWCYKMAKAN